MAQTRTLYEPSFEHDACGFGFVVDIAGRPSHAIVRDALTVLVNLEHRGADRVRGEHRRRRRHPDPDPARASCAARPRPASRSRAAAATASAWSSCRATRPAAAAPASASSASSRDEGLTILGWRDVPTDRTGLGDTARGQPAGHPPGVHRPPAGRAGATRTSPSSAALRRPPPGREGRRPLRRSRAAATSTSRRCPAGPSSTRACSTPEQLLTFYPDLRDDALRERARPWSTRASRPTPSRPGTARIRTATSATTARSTRCAAT